MNLPEIPDRPITPLEAVSLLESGHLTYEGFKRICRDHQAGEGRAPKLPDGCEATPVEAIRVTGPLGRGAWCVKFLDEAGWDTSNETTPSDLDADRFALWAWRREGAPC